ncbi:MAG: tyrosine-type recombinase/integrase [Propionibacteriaceae bacterium]
MFPGADGQPLSPGQVHGHSPRFDTRTGKKTHPGNGFYRARYEIGRPDFRFHDQRHFAATMAAISGATTKELMQFAGHSDIHVARRYQEALTDRKRDSPTAWPRSLAFLKGRHVRMRQISSFRL